MAFKDTLEAMMKKHSIPKGKVAILMGVSCDQVYRYLSGKSQPRWESVLSLLDGLGYRLKIVKKDKGVSGKNEAENQD